MNKSFILFIFSIILLGCFCQESGKLKAAKLRQLSENSENGIIEFNSTGFKYFVMEYPRPYQLVLLYTLPTYELCQTVETHFIETAQMYKNDGSEYPKMQGEKKLDSVFFAKLNYNKENELYFWQNGFTSVPNLQVHLPKAAKFQDGDARIAYLEQFSWTVRTTFGIISTQKILEFANKRTGRDIQYKEPIYKVFIVIFIFAVVAICGYYLFQAFKSFWLNKTLWFFGSMVIFILCSGGIVFDILHGTPMFPQGNKDWISDGGRQQYGFEGFAMAGLIALVGLLLIVIEKIAKFQNNLLQKGFVKELMILGLLYVIYTIIVYLESVSQKKGRSIQHNFSPPPHYIQGFSILLFNFDYCLGLQQMIKEILFDKID